jgi:hypothetical protein
MEQGDIRNLLSRVSEISKKYDEIAKITGENFNVFSIMRAESDEVRTHSRIIAELLNPKGRHGQGSVFLKLFFEGISDLENLKKDFDFENAKVLVEEHAGLINEEYTVGGFVDIVIKGIGNQIVIENKIYAGDQLKQLLRYKKAYPKCKLLYLTLDGKEPSKESYEGESEILTLEQIILVSYHTNIVNWLEKCLEKMHSLPIIRETLVQYLHLIKKLTNQTTNDKMSEEIVELLEKDIRGSFEISNNISNLKDKLYSDLIQNLKLTKGFTVVDTANSGYFGVDFKCEDIDRVISVLFGKVNKGYNSVSCGYLIDNKDVSEILKNDYKSRGFTVNEGWVYKWLKSRSWGDDPKIWEDVAQGKDGEIYKEIIEIIEEIIKIESLKTYNY